jgi:hypothetical protein
VVAGSNPAIWLGLIVLLSVIRFGGIKLMETMMKKSPNISKRDDKTTNGKSLIQRTAYRVFDFLPSLIETGWAVSCSLVASMVLPSIHQGAARNCAAPS